MAEFLLNEVVKATSGILVQGDSDLWIAGVSIDSRRVRPGEIFFAIKGESHDGHNFLKAAVAAGAAAVVVMTDPSEPLTVPLVKVADTLTALGDLARYHRQRLQIPVIGVTGSNGKTTTKDLIAAVLAEKFAVVKTEANFNNEIGLPLTIFSISHSTQVAVVEMGMRGLGQIRELALIACPTIAVVTNIGLTHLERLGSQALIAQAKGELIEALPENGLAILNGDDPLVRQLRQLTKARTVFFGSATEPLDYRTVLVEATQNGFNFEVACPDGQVIPINLPIPGRHNVLNALAAVAVAKELGCSVAAIQQGLSQPALSAKRLNLLEANGCLIIDDTYNASPASLKAALDVLAALEGRRRIAVLGDMLELGPAAAAAHQQLGVYAGQIGIDQIWAVGELARGFVKGINSLAPNRGHHFPDKLALIGPLKEALHPGDAVLVKGSRGMKMEEIVEALIGEETARQ